MLQLSEVNEITLCCVVYLKTIGCNMFLDMGKHCSESYFVFIFDNGDI